MEGTSDAVNEGIRVRQQIGWLTTSAAASRGSVLCCRSNNTPVKMLPTDAMMER